MKNGDWHIEVGASRNIKSQFIANSMEQLDIFRASIANRCLLFNLELHSMHFFSYLWVTRFFPQIISLMNLLVLFKACKLKFAQINHSSKQQHAIAK